jgi:hypothetical protein
MIKFNDYLNLQELAAYQVGSDLMGKTSLDDASQKAITVAFQAFEAIMAHHSSEASSFLNRMSMVIPEVKTLMQNNGIESFKDSDFKGDMRRAAMKGSKFLEKGLGDVTPQDASQDVIAKNIPDTPSGDGW